VTAATHVLYYLGPPSYWPLFVPHVLRLLTVSREVERVVLADLLIISKKDPVCISFGFQAMNGLLTRPSLNTLQDLLALHFTRFLVRCDDLGEVKKAKIRLMLNVVNDENWAAILREFIVRFLSLR
jgi:AP-3 complex subunit beta